MKKEEIQLLFSQFEQVSCTLNDVECWSARDLCTLFGYKLWQNFTKVIDKAKDACANVGQQVEDHFIDVNKMVAIGSGAERQVDDIMLTRLLAILWHKMATLANRKLRLRRLTLQYRHAERNL